MLFSAYLSEESRQPDPAVAEIFSDLAYYPWFAEYYWVNLPGMDFEPHPLLTGLYPTRDLAVSLAPDQSQIAFERFVHSAPIQGTGSVYIAATDGSESQQVSQLPNDYVLGSSWSADSQVFAYWTALDWNSFETEHNIYIHDVIAGSTATINIEAGQPTDAALSPDGSQIVFAAFGDTPGMYLINSDGSGQQLIQAGAIDWVDWHPDRDRIFFAQFDPETGIFSYDVSNGQIKPITPPDTRRPLRPVISPDGLWLAFDANGIYVISTDGGDPLQLTGGGLDQWVWSPDSRYIAYLAGSQVFVMDIRGNGRVAVTPLDLNADELIGWLP